jgi:hypothetical protein
MFFDIVNAEYISDYKIKIEFEDGSKGEADLSEYPEENTVFKSFFDINFFKDFTIQDGTLIWGNGELDIAPETLYTMATGKPIIFGQKQYSH